MIFNIYILFIYHLQLSYYGTFLLSMSQSYNVSHKTKLDSKYLHLCKSKIPKKDKIPINFGLKIYYEMFFSEAEAKHLVFEEN